MAEFGDFNDKTPLIDDKNDDDKNDDKNAAGGNVTTGFDVPQSSITPRHRTTTMNMPSETASWLEDSKNLGSFSSTTFTAQNEIKKEFPYAVKDKIKYMMDDKGRVMVGLIEFKKPYYLLLTKVPGKDDEYQINKSIPKEVLRALGKSRREEIENEIKSLSDQIIINKDLAEKLKNQTEKNKAHERAQIQIARRADLYNELGHLKKGEYTRQGGGQTIALEVFSEKRTQ